MDDFSKWLVFCAANSSVAVYPRNMYNFFYFVLLWPNWSSALNKFMGFSHAYRASYIPLPDSPGQVNLPVGKFILQSCLLNHILIAQDCSNSSASAMESLQSALTHSYNLYWKMQNFKSLPSENFCKHWALPYSLTLASVAVPMKSSWRRWVK